MKKGFTLVELLAVIVVLGIVAVVAYPMLGDTIENSKRKSFTSSLEGIYRTVDIENARNGYEHDSTYTYSNGVLTKTRANGSNITPVTIKVKGGVAEGNGSVSVDKNGNIIITIENDKYCGYTTSGNHNIQIGEGSCTEYASADSWTNGSCFGFDSSTGTITSYDESCGGDIVIPYSINSIKVRNIGDLAFTHTHEDVEVCIYDEINEECSYMPLSSAKARGLENYYVDGGVTSMEEINSIDFTNATDLETIGVGAFYKSSLTSIDLSNLKKLEIIGNSAFESSHNLTTVNLKGLIKLKKINNSVFYGNQIATLNLDGLTNLTTIGDYAFGDNNLTTIDLSGLSNLTTIGVWAFGGNQIAILNLDGLTNLTTIEESAFEDNQINSLDLSGLTKLETIEESAFKNNQINSLDLSGLTKLETIEESAFYENQIATLNLDGLTNLTTIGYCAYKDNQIATLNLNGLTNLTTIEESAFEDNQINSLDLSGLTKLETIEESAFYGNQIATLNLDGLTNLTTIGKWAFGNNNLTTLDLSGLTKLETIEESAFYENQIATLNLDGLTNLTTIGNEAFYNNQISSLSLPSSLTYIGDGAFNKNKLPEANAYIYYRNEDKTIDNTKMVSYGGILRGITIPDNVNSITSDALSGLSLNSVTINKGYNGISGSPWGGNVGNVIWTTALKYNITNNVANITVGSNCLYDSKYYAGCRVTLSAPTGKNINSVTVNGTVYNGSSFTMPNNDATIESAEMVDIVILQSPHNYSNNMNQTYSATIPGAASLSLKFNSITQFENNCDYLKIYDVNNNLIGSYTNTSLASKTITVPGNYVKLVLTTDGSVTKYGFYVEITKAS